MGFCLFMGFNDNRKQNKAAISFMLTAANKFDKIGSNILKKFSNMEISFYIQIVCSQATSTLNVKKK